MNKLLAASACAFAAMACSSLSSAEPEAKTVFTRAQVTSSYQDANNQSYVRLKLLPRAKLPFTTLTFRVTDRSLLDGIADGASVRFTSRHVDGQNVLTAIQLAPPCVRLQPCD